MKFFAKKSLGQNFLKSEAALAQIIQAAHLDGTETVLEIGPGTGALTRELLRAADRVVAIEKDDQLSRDLHTEFATEIASDKLVVMNADILDIEPHAEILGSAYKLVANIPYNITGAIIEKFLSAKFQPTMMVLLVQKEVAERIVAVDRASGKPDKESILSIAVKAYGTPRYVATVKAGSFVPAPKVDSAIIAIESISRNHFPTLHHEQVFFQLVKTGFAHKRKTLAGNLKNNWEPEIVDGAIAAVGLPVAVRAEEIRIETWVALMHAVYEATYR